MVGDCAFGGAVGALDQAVVSGGVGTYATAGPTAPVPAGELIVAALITGGRPGSVTAGSSQMVPYLIDAQNGSASSDLADILSSAAGPQEGSPTLGSLVGVPLAQRPGFPRVQPDRPSQRARSSQRAHAAKRGRRTRRGNDGADPAHGQRSSPSPHQGDGWTTQRTA